MGSSSVPRSGSRLPRRRGLQLVGVGTPKDHEGWPFSRATLNRLRRNAVVASYTDPQLIAGQSVNPHNRAVTEAERDLLWVLRGIKGECSAHTLARFCVVGERELVSRECEGLSIILRIRR